MSLEGLLNRKPPTRWEQFRSSPLLFFAKFLFQLLPTPSPSLTASSVRVVCISDTHNGQDRIPPLPDGDVLIHAGDLTESGSLDELKSALDWLNKQPHPYKVFIGGNHEKCLGEDPTCRPSIENAYPNLIYLENSSTTLVIRNRTLNIYGSPLTPTHGSFAFQYPRIRSMPPQNGYRNPWEAIPMDTDVLITHGPPFAHLDMNYGCQALLDAIWRVKPKLHVFGHIHAGRGVSRLTWGRDQRAFEHIIEKRGWFSWVRLIVVAWGVLRRAFMRLVRMGGDNATLLVNASSTGGYRDELRRRAIVVDI